MTREELRYVVFSLQHTECVKDILCTLGPTERIGGLSIGARETSVICAVVYNQLAAT